MGTARLRDDVCECARWRTQRRRRGAKRLVDRERDLRMKNVEVHIFPDVLHGYMMRANPKAYDPVTREFSMRRALAILEDLRTWAKP